MLSLLFEKFLENRIACVFRWSLAALFRLGEAEDSAPTYVGGEGSGGGRRRFSEAVKGGS